MVVVVTSRLTLREFQPNDASFILELLNEEGFLRFIGDKGVRTLDDARDYLSSGPMESYRHFGFGLYLVSLRSDGTAVGMCGLVKRETLPDADIGFAFLTRHWSKGYAAESAAGVLSYARETLGLERVIAIAALDNEGSSAVLNKIGLRVQRRVRLVAEGPELNLFGPAPLSST